MGNLFDIRISKQFWLGPPTEDLCSHGELYIKVEETVITQPGIEEEWGISESALALLRTLGSDYVCDPEHDDGLILHGCGTMLMMSCPISIHWSVRHRGDQVVLSDFVKFTTTNPETGRVDYPGLEVTVSREDYQERILTFARQAKKFFEEAGEKRIEDEFDQEMYESFWTEFNELVERHSQRR